jgi:adenine-specific DNA glycosylase
MGPLCPICPIQKFCKAQTSNPEQFPEKKIGPKTKLLKRIAAIFEKDGKILLQKSEDHRWMKGLWQIPSLFSENGDPTSRILSRLAEHLGFSLNTVGSLPEMSHSVTHHRITIHPFHFKQVKGHLKSHPSSERRWFSPTEIAAIGLPAADRKILNRLVS